jgi:uncharacterized membrane protein (DUF4010 family)
MDLPPFAYLAIALGLGFLVGLEREWAGSPVAGIRTFPLITVLGTIAALLAPRFGGWIVGGALVAVAVMVGIGAWGEIDAARRRNPDAIGITTEIAALVMFTVGAALGAGFVVESAVTAGVVAVLLHHRQPLHGLVARIGEGDARAIFRFVLIGLVILPLLPDRAFDRYQVLNPFEIWLMVVLIVGISLAAYIASRLLGKRRGLLATGLLGGLISSTATTVSYARSSRRAPATADAAAFVIVAASTVVFARVLIEIAVVAPAMVAATAPPLAAVMFWMVVLAVVFFRRVARESTEVPDQEPPSELNTAITFGLLYAAVLFAVAVTKEKFGDRALYLVAGLSGLTDMDAITLSTAKLANAKRLAADTAWRLILVGAMANLVFKGLVVAALGDARLRSRVAALFGLALGGAALVLWLWPG